MNSRFIHLICVLLMATYAASCSKHEQSKPAEKTLYTCGMHPQVVQDRPGNCPICGMKLVPVRQQSSPTALAATSPSPGRGDRQSSSSGSRKIKYYKSTMMLGEISQTPRKDSMGMDMVPVYEGEEETNEITVDPSTVQKMGVRTAIVTKGPVRRIIRTVGAVSL